MAVAPPLYFLDWLPSKPSDITERFISEEEFDLKAILTLKVPFRDIESYPLIHRHYTENSYKPKIRYGKVVYSSDCFEIFKFIDEKVDIPENFVEIVIPSSLRPKGIDDGVRDKIDYISGDIMRSYVPVRRKYINLISRLKGSLDYTHVQIHRWVLRDVLNERIKPKYLAMFISRFMEGMSLNLFGLSRQDVRHFLMPVIGKTASNPRNIKTNDLLFHSILRRIETCSAINHQVSLRTFLFGLQRLAINLASSRKRAVKNIVMLIFDWISGNVCDTCFLKEVVGPLSSYPLIQAQSEETICYRKYEGHVGEHGSSSVFIEDLLLGNLTHVSYFNYLISVDILKGGTYIDFPNHEYSKFFLQIYCQLRKDIMSRHICGEKVKSNIYIDKSESLGLFIWLNENLGFLGDHFRLYFEHGYISNCFVNSLGTFNSTNVFERILQGMVIYSLCSNYRSETFKKYVKYFQR
jgi:hypothetical protein